MATSSDVRKAVTAKLLNDATLTALLPDGVYRDISGNNAQRFAIINQQDHDEVYGQPSTSLYEEFVYLVKAVVKSSSGTDIDAAAARIHTLLQDAALTITGYGLMLCDRIEHLEYTEVDPTTKDRWMHSGGLYRVVARPTA